MMAEIMCWNYPLSGIWPILQRKPRIQHIPAFTKYTEISLLLFLIRAAALLSMKKLGSLGSGNNLCSTEFHIQCTLILMELLFSFSECLGFINDSADEFTEIRKAPFPGAFF